MQTAAAYLAEQLERLMSLPLGTPEDLQRWLDESDKVTEKLAASFPEFEPSDNFHHFLADPDIRLRDLEYREYQHGLMAAYIRRLRE